MARRSIAARGPTFVALVVLASLLVGCLPLAGPAPLGSAGVPPSSLHPRSELSPPPVPGAFSMRAPGAPVRVTGSGVNPYLHYASEPAPMGLTDFGVWPNGTAYSYSTPEFVGIARFDNYSTYTSALGTSQSGLQLNVVVYLDVGGTTYEYWIQDVLFLATSTDNVQFLDNIWNFSAGSFGGLYSTTVTGNGSCRCSSTQPGIYIDVAGSQPGNNVNLTNPFTVELRAVATIVGGTPRVYFDYSDGYGWQTFDTANFVFATGVSSAAFRVDGTQYLMGSLYDDAELVLGGPGGGTSTSIKGGGVDLTLEYDNGHDLQAVPSAFNFGSDTAETIDHVGASYGGAVNGTTPSDLVQYGSGNLSGLYDPSTYGGLRVLAGLAPNATLWVNDTPVPYRGGTVALSLLPGVYVLSTRVNGTVVGEANVTVVAGTTVVVELPPARFDVTFMESGLPVGTSWGVRVGGSTRTTTGTVLSIAETNGSYGYSFVAVPGFVPPRPPYAIDVAGAPVVLEVRFWPFNFSVRFDALNLPPGTAWSVTFGSLSASGATDALTFAVPNGTYAYAVGSPVAYAPSPASGNVTVRAGASEVSIDFSIRPGYLVGIVRPANATVLLNGGPVATVGGAFNVSEIPGTFSLEAIAPGYVPQFRNVTLTPGDSTTVEFDLVRSPATSPGGSHPAPGGLAVPSPVVIGAAVGVVVAGALAALWWTRRRGP